MLLYGLSEERGIGEGPNESNPLGFISSQLLLNIPVCLVGLLVTVSVSHPNFFLNS